MRTLSLSILLLVAALSPAAPALAEKPPKWEYAELTFRTTAGRSAAVDADGNEVPATPPTTTLRWTTGAAEVEVKGWDELADKLKAPALKKGTAAFQKMQILNYLGADGWELMEQQGTTSPSAFGDRGATRPTGFGATSGTWLLKRRVP